MPTSRRGWRIACAAGTVLAVGGAPATVRAGDALVLKPASEYRAELEAMLSAGQPGAGDNAWDHLLSAIDARSIVDEWAAGAWTPDMPFSEEPYNCADEMRFGVLDLEARKPGLELLRRTDEAGVWAAIDSAGQSPRRIAPFPWDPGNGPGNMSNEHIRRNRLRPIGLAAISAMRVAHVRSDDPGVRAMAARSVTLASILAGDRDWTAVLLGTVQCTLVCREVCQEIMEQPYGDAMLAAVDAELARIDPFPSPDGWLAALPVVERFGAASDPDRYKETAGDPAAVIPIVDGVVAHALGELDAPFARRERPGAGWAERLAAHLFATKNMGDDLEGRMDLIPIVERVQGTVESALDSDAYARTMLAGTRAVIAIERYRIAMGQLPDSLGALVPEFLAAVPIDPMTGKPMLYTRLRHDPHGRAYLVYSTGIDGVDNGGREPAGEMYPNPTDIEEDFDFIVNQPRRSLDS